MNSEFPFSPTIESKIFDKIDPIQKILEAATSAIAELNTMDYLNRIGRSELVCLDDLPETDKFYKLIKK